MKTAITLIVVLLGIVVLIVIVGFVRYSFTSNRVAQDMLNAAQPQAPVVTSAMLDGLPAPVQRYMQVSGVVGRPVAKSARLRQTGRIRATADAAWMPLRAEQIYSVNPPAFLWSAQATVAGLPAMRVRDTYTAGHGHMFATVAGLVPVMDMRGPEMDQGSLMRLLNEMMWFPSAYLSANVTWQAVDDNRAQVTLTDGDLAVTATMTFDDQGRVTNFLADRYRDNGDGTATLMPWSTPISEYRVYPSGLLLPSRGTGVWHLPSGEELIYVELEILDVEENPAEIY